MSEEKKDKPTVIHIDRARIKKLEVKGNYWKLFEEFDTLRLKLAYEKAMTHQDANRFVTLLRYMMKNGHSDSIKYMARKLYEIHVLGIK